MGHGGLSGPLASIALLFELRDTRLQIANPPDEKDRDNDDYRRNCDEEDEVEDEYKNLRWAQTHQGVLLSRNSGVEDDSLGHPDDFERGGRTGRCFVHGSARVGASTCNIRLSPSDWRDVGRSVQPMRLSL
jgi:hypothetical protein